MSEAGAHSSKPPSRTFWKGKARATENDFDDLNPTITYRHLLSNNLGVRDPLRVIALCDSDAFYAACEQVRLGIDPTRPLCVLQWNSFIAVNYPARKFGISRFGKVSVAEAKKLCPELVVVHVATYKEGESEPGYWENPDTRTHKVSLDLYRRESLKVIQMFKDGLPGGEVEKASIDEAFIDFTKPVREELLKRYPHLAAVPPDAPDGLDTPLPRPPPVSWDGKGSVIPVNPPSEEKEEPTDTPAEGASAGGAPDCGGHARGDLGVGEEDEQTTWHDVALSIAAEFMLRIREDIRTKLGYTTSAGLARNKFLAKLTASYKKPMNQTILRNAAIPNYLRPMPFQKIRFLGGKLGKALAEEYDVSTVGDLLCEMQRKFGEDSIWVYEILRGIDRSEVKEKSAINKSMLAAKNVPQPITKFSEGHQWIRVLAPDLALRLNEARETNPALWPKTIVLHIRRGYETGRSKQIPFPFNKNVTVDLIASFGDKLWKELVGPGPSTPFKITNISLSFSGIGSMEVGQRTIEGFLTTRTASDDPRPPSPDPGKPPSKRRRSSDPCASSSTLESGMTVAQLEGMVIETCVDDPSRASQVDERLSFICEKCEKRIRLEAAPPGFGSGLRSPVADDVDGTAPGAGGGDNGGSAHDDGIIEDALAALRLEHADFHFAQELAAAGEREEGTPRRVIRPWDGPPPSKKKKKGKKGEEGGIAKFFQRK
ncbi:DNA/RNA polymerase [Daedaleopsis nitida]|nr:DNA/RNA polymerase [Daedaleopsis nitida]